jgi:hypothetical protein
MPYTWGFVYCGQRGRTAGYPTAPAQRSGRRFRGIQLKSLPTPLSQDAALIRSNLGGGNSLPLLPPFGKVCPTLHLLLRLDNSHLRTTHVPVGLLSVDTVPGHRATQARASDYFGRSLFYAFLFLRPHQLSRDEKPSENLPVFAWGDLVRVRTQPLSASLQDSLRFFHLPMPASPSASLTGRFP